MATEENRIILRTKCRECMKQAMDAAGMRTSCIQYVVSSFPSDLMPTAHEN